MFDRRDGLGSHKYLEVSFRRLCGQQMIGDIHGRDHHVQLSHGNKHEICRTPVLPPTSRETMPKQPALNVAAWPSHDCGQVKSFKKLEAVIHWYCSKHEGN